MEITSSNYFVLTVKVGVGGGGRRLNQECTHLYLTHLVDK